MSLDLVVSCFRDGELHPLPAAFWRTPIEPHVRRTETDCLSLQFDDGSEPDVHLRTKAADMTGLMLSHAGPHPALWAAVLAWLQHEGVVLIVPGAVPPIVGAAGSGRHLPASLVEALGEPVQVDRPAEILAWIELA